MKVNKVSSTPSFGMAKMSRKVEKFISDAQKICPPKEKANLDDAIKSIKTLFPDTILTATRNKFYLIKEKVQGKGQKVSDYKFVTTISTKKGDKVRDVRGVAAGMEFANLGIASSYMGMVSCHVPPQKMSAVDAYVKKWSDFYKSPCINKA